MEPLKFIPNVEFAPESEKPPRKSIRLNPNKLDTGIKTLTAIENINKRINNNLAGLFTPIKKTIAKESNKAPAIYGLNKNKSTREIVKKIRSLR